MRILSATDPQRFGGFRLPADDPPKPWRLRAEALQRSGAPVGVVRGILNAFYVPQDEHFFCPQISMCFQILEKMN